VPDEDTHQAAASRVIMPGHRLTHVVVTLSPRLSITPRSVNRRTGNLRRWTPGSAWNVPENRYDSMTDPRRTSMTRCSFRPLYERTRYQGAVFFPRILKGRAVVRDLRPGRGAPARSHGEQGQQFFTAGALPRARHAVENRPSVVC